MPLDEEADAWFDRELAGCSFADERLNKRLRKLVAQIGSAMGESIPLVCQDWANTEAAYRFFSNDRVSVNRLANLTGGQYCAGRMTVIWHDGQGACLFTKRLERGRFIWPSVAGEAVTISPAQMSYLLSGIDWRNPQEAQRPTRVG